MIKIMVAAALLVSLSAPAHAQNKIRVFVVTNEASTTTTADTIGQQVVNTIKSALRQSTQYNLVESNPWSDTRPLVRWTIVHIAPAGQEGLATTFTLVLSYDSAGAPLEGSQFRVRIRSCSIGSVVTVQSCADGALVLLEEGLNELRTKNTTYYNNLVN